MIKWGDREDIEPDTGRWSPGMRPDYNSGDKSNTGGITMRLDYPHTFISLPIVPIIAIKYSALDPV